MEFKSEAKNKGSKISEIRRHDSSHKLVEIHDMADISRSSMFSINDNHSMQDIVTSDMIQESRESRVKSSKSLSKVHPMPFLNTMYSDVKSKKFINQSSKAKKFSDMDIKSLETLEYTFNNRPRH